MPSLIIGTRGSRLALAQTEWVCDNLRKAFPDLEIATKTIVTRGDSTQALGTPLSSFGEKGIFAKELESALIDREIDLAVHSMKDMVHTLPESLIIAAIPEREDPRDCMLGGTLDSLPRGAKIGTGSVRRRALLLFRRPDLQIAEIRGNIDTRLQKLQSGQYDAICLAVAGLNRLGLQEYISEILDPQWFTPDTGQGALCLETRADNAQAREMAHALNHLPTWYNVVAERAFLKEIGGSCQSPVGAWASTDSSGNGAVTLTAMAGSPTGEQILRFTVAGQPEHAERLGQEAAAKLRENGADRLL